MIAKDPTVTDPVAERTLFSAVADLIVEIAQAHIVPRYRALADGDVMVKSRNEVVTAVDRDVEARLLAGLGDLDPGARLIGEESVEAGTATLKGLGSGRVWLIDPLDGTANFAAGTGAFGVMVALLVDGATRAGWLYDPLAKVMSTAVAGEGSFVDGERATVRPPRGPRPVASIAGQFMSPALRESLTAVAATAMELRPIPRCAAAHYPMLVAGEHDLAIFQRTLPWDHAAGALFLTEAGGFVSRWNGEPYSAASPGLGIIAATSASLGRQAARTMRTALDEVGDDGLR